MKTPAGFQLDEVVSLRGGHVSSRVERLVGCQAGAPRSYVRKRATESELAAHELLAAVPGLASARCVLADMDEDGPWIVTEFVDGEVGVLGAVLPDEIYATLGTVHARFADDPSATACLPVVDGGYWSALCLEVAVRELEAREDLPDALTGAVSELRGWAGSARLRAFIDALPRTLVHGDMHPGNVVLADGVGTIIDWGNARLGPPMLDLANVTELRSPWFDVYVDAWESTAGRPFDHHAARSTFAYATAQVNVQYLGFTVRNGADDVAAAMIARARVALESLDLLG